MNRRTYLAGTAAAGVAGVAGCLGVLGNDSPGATENVVLAAPDEYDKLRESRDEGYLPHPIHADELPAATVPDALTGEEISTRQFVGERHTLLTFIFTRCHGPCLRLTANLAQVQADALENGYNDEFAFMPTTFDPEYDTPERLETFAEERGAAVDAGNWYMLRPQSEERVEAVVGEKFGVFVDRTDGEGGDNSTAENDTAGTQSGQRGDDVSLLHEGEDHGNESDNGHGQFNHLSMILLANADGYVERAYTGGRVPNAAGLLEDIETLRNRW